MSQKIAPLPAFEEVIPRSPDDEQCFNEIREVLERHGAQRRFGICLLHEHFPVAEDELMVETTEPETRTSTLRPARRNEVMGQGMLETAWRLDIGSPVQHCVRGCKWEYNPNTQKDEHIVTHKYGEPSW